MGTNATTVGTATVGGAATGAAIGSAAGPVGTAVGAVAGGVIGFGAGMMANTQTDWRSVSPGLEDENARKQRFADAINAYYTRDASTNQFRQGQVGLAGQLQQTANGQGPSIAGQYLAQAQNTNTANAMAQAASMRGGVNPALAQRLAMQNAATQNQTAAGQAAMLRTQEAQGAQAQLGQLYAQGRSGDQSFQNENDQMAAQYENMGMNAAQTDLAAEMESQKINAGIEQANTANSTKLLGGLIGGGSSMGAAAAAAAHGAIVPGHARVSGDSRLNDTKPYMLSPGEIVIPRSVASSGPAHVAAFVHALQKRHAAHAGPSGYAAVLAARQGRV